MKKLLSFVMAAGFSLSVASVLSRPANSEVVVNDDAPAAELIAGYRQWTRVNPEPQVVASQIAIQCAAPTLTQQHLEDGNPHRDKLVVVYVNDVGRVAMMEQKQPVFPVGSVVVKEKLTTKDSAVPELLTVMRKREPGYDPERGNWEYMVFDGPGKVLQASGKLEKCQGCHLLERNTDYISRRYLPADVWQKLK
ncbi:MAG TPA: cytochrome P460 family protein [Pyrinomonadaceae bacterium]